MGELQGIGGESVEELRRMARRTEETLSDWVCRRMDYEDSREPEDERARR
jgi:hypothetical protein